MQYRSSQSTNGIWSIFLRLTDRVKRLAIACICAEKCRFCGREIALGFEGDSNNQFNDKDFADSQITIDTIRTIEGNQKAPYVEPKSPGIFKNPGIQKMYNAASSHTKKLTALVSLLKEPGQSLKNELVSLSLAATHAALVPPALLKLANQPNLYPRLSECLCSVCWEEIDIDLPTLGFVRLSNSAQIELPVASGAHYGGKIKELIRTFKYDGDTTLAADLASIMSLGWSALSDYMPASNIVLVPVPLHKSRKRMRGYNQSELLARELSQIISLPVAANALSRAKATRPQQVLGKSERLKNVSNSFVGKKQKLAGKTVVLIDDVCTSGSTLSACADEALGCGALSVVALTIARALLAHDN